MVLDYATGFVLAAVFKKSRKTNTGGLESNIGFKGFFKKGVALAVVFVAYRLDLMVGSEFIGNAVIIGYIVNEAISITKKCRSYGNTYTRSN